MTIETWRKLPILGGHYEVSTHGRVRACERIVYKANQHGGISKQVYKQRLLNGTLRKGYRCHHLGYKHKKYNYPCHYLVLLTFVGDRPEGMECCHNDGDSLNNKLSNLRWDTHHQNNQDRKKHGNYPTGEDHPMNKYSDEIINKIRSRKISYNSANKKYGISQTHFYRIRKRAFEEDEAGGAQSP